jgi:hypothetical protein
MLFDSVSAPELRTEMAVAACDSARRSATAIHG